jgi:exopolysaccharide production protein ExoQ
MAVGAARLGRDVESVGVVVVLLVISQAVLPLLFHGGAHSTDNGPPTSIERLAYWSAYLFTLVQVARRPNAIMRAAVNNWLVCGVVLLALLSAAWSIDPVTTVRQASALLVWTVFGFYLASRFRVTELIKHLGVALGVVAILSLAFALLVPRLGVSNDLYATGWRGVFRQKNMLGDEMLLASIIFGLLTVYSKGWIRGIGLAFLALSVGLLIMSRSATSLVILCVVFACFPAIAGLGRRGRRMAVAMYLMVIAMPAVAIAATEPEAILHALGRDTTLTGRTELWGEVWNSIRVKPILGYGYGAFWESTSSESATIRTALGWDAPHSHNTVLDTWLDTGVIGVATFLCMVMVAAARASSALRLTCGIEAAWPSLIILMMIPMNSVESTLFHLPLSWVVFVAASAYQPAERRSAIRLSPAGYGGPPLTYGRDARQ